jgi:uncharacterized protein YegJ (DUF2314 family)
MNHLARSVILAVLALVCAAHVHAQTGSSPQTPQPAPQASPTPLQDKPVSVNSDELQRYEDAIKPYVEKARKTYPGARDRYLKGLPPRHAFYVTTRLHDKEGRFEQVFIAVREIKDGKIKGIIASDVQFITAYKGGESYSFPESELLDWTIVRPDGSEEGNFVGKFLDEYQKRQ